MELKLGHTLALSHRRDDPGMRSLTLSYVPPEIK